MTLLGARNGRYGLAKPIHDAVDAGAGRLGGPTVRAVGAAVAEAARVFDFSGFGCVERLLVLLGGPKGCYWLARAVLRAIWLRGRGAICLWVHLMVSSYQSICLSFYRSIGL
jgi:hypothetical protein